MKNTLAALIFISFATLFQLPQSVLASVPAKPRVPRIARGYVELSDGVQRYVEVSKPKAGKPWIVFVNGLVYEIERWAQMDQELRAEGYGIVHYYLRGQDYTLAREVETFKTPKFFKSGLESKDFASELSDLLIQLHIEEKVTVVGLSYGAHVAASFSEYYPEQVDQVVFMAPLVVPLEKYQPQGAWLDWNLAWVRATWGPYFYEYAYRQIYGAYLNKRVEDRVPEHLAAIPTEYKESLFHLIRAVRDFDLRSYKFDHLDRNSVFFMVSQEDEPQAFKDQLSSFDGITKATQGSLIWLPEAAHAIPDTEPHRASQYLQHIIARDPRLKPGQKYKSTARGLTKW